MSLKNVCAKLIQVLRGLFSVENVQIECEECGEITLRDGEMMPPLYFYAKRWKILHRRCEEKLQRRERISRPEERSYESMTKDDVLDTLRHACDFLGFVESGGYNSVYLRERAGEVHRALAGMALFFHEKEEWFSEERASSSNAGSDHRSVHLEDQWKKFQDLLTEVVEKRVPSSVKRVLEL